MRYHGKIRMFEPEKVFFTADLHFFHKRSIDNSNRPFATVDEMHAALIGNWNSVVPENGIVFVLGDMFWKTASMEQCKAVMSSLNGTKYLVGGNHDLAFREEYLEMGFENAWDYLEVLIQKLHVVCFHYPIEQWNGYYHGWLHFHGHTHGKISHESLRVMDVGVDVHNYRPVRWLDVKDDLERGIEIDTRIIKERGGKC